MAELKHIAFIMDGNRRWAKKRGLSSNAGHREGVEALIRTIKALCEVKIPYASFFAFSTQNWSRSKDEINSLIKLAEEYFEKKTDFYEKYSISVKFFGDLSVFPKKTQQILKSVEEKTKNFSALKIGICLNYGGREDVVQAVNKLIKQGKTSVNENDILQNLYSASFPEPDFVVRTSGEMRLSNFMLFQMAYSELYFPKCYWPSFGKKQLLKAIKVFSKRHRRFGGNK